MENYYSMKVRGSPKEVNLIKETFNVREERKYKAQTMTQNFFADGNTETEDYNAVYRQINTTPRRKSPQQTARKIRTSRKKKDAAIKLEPMKQTEKIDIFESLAIKNNLDDIEEIFIATPKKQAKKSEPLSSNDKLKRSSRRINKKLQLFSEVEVPVSFQAPKLERNEQSEMTKRIDDCESQLLFDDKQPQNQEEKFSQLCEKEVRKDSNDEEIIFAVPKRNFAYEFKEEDEQENEKEHSRADKAGNNEISYEHFTFSNEKLFIQQLHTDVAEGHTLQMELIRDNTGFNSFWPQYHLKFAQDKLHVLSAKKTSSRPSSTFILSRSNHDFEEGSPFYFGKIKSNTLGQSYNIYGPGLNPSDAKQKRVTPRELLATIVYSTSLFHKSGPRKFSIFIKKPQIKYYQDFLQVKKYGQEIPLNVLYQYIDNKQKFRVLHNRQAKFNAKLGGFQALDFRGKAECLSIKNFILEQTPDGPQILLFCKCGENKYNLQISGGISPNLAFAIAISTFDNRLIYE